MNKQIFLFSLSAMTCTALVAAPRTMTEARKLAQQELTLRLGRPATLSPMPLLATADRSEADFQPYYHFTDAESSAFVFVSGSDLMPAVIGYGDHWTDDALSPNMQSWLTQVEEAEQYLESHPEAAQLQLQALAESDAYETIDPILTCNWGQTAPFNSYCPGTSSRQSAVGCMATALCQIMYSQRWPTESFGKISYKNLGVPMSVSFEGLTYNYDLMLDTYKAGEYTDEQKEEVAKLCYYVGTACKMQYGQSSGTIELEAIDGMRKHFGMKYAALTYRHNYSLREWNQLLQTQLRERLPILLTGQSNAGGHAFVLDGLDEKGFYHVNWGWEGAGNGFYDISILHTDIFGTGASANDGFNIENQALMNLCNPEKVNRWYCELNTYRTHDFSDYDQIWCKYEGTLQRGTELNFETYPVNYSFEPIVGKVGVKVMRSGLLYDLKITDTDIDVDRSVGTVDAGGNFSWWPTDTEVMCSYTIPEDIEDGKYLLYLVVQPEGETWVDAIRQYNNNPSYWTLTVNGNTMQLNHRRQSDDEVGIQAIEAELTARPGAGTYDVLGRNKVRSVSGELTPGLYVIDGQKRVVTRR